jgi:hypothetical protein
VRTYCDRAQINLGAFGIEEISKDCIERLVLGHLRQHQADQAVADDEVVGLGDLGQGAVAAVQHLADDREDVAVQAGDIAQVEQGDQGAGVGLLHIKALRIAEQDHMLVAGNVERVQRAAVGGVACLKMDLLMRRSAQRSSSMAAALSSSATTVTTEPAGTY